MASVYHIITERITKLLEQGTVPWRQPWHGPDSHPKNLVSGKEYRGMNALILGSAGYASPYWLSYRQAEERGSSVRKGQHGHPCIFWKWLEYGEDEGIRKIPFLRYSTVFNVLQCEGIEFQLISIARTNQPIKACEQIVSGMPNPPRIKHEGERACYDPAGDLVSMPPRNSFDHEEAYYSVLFHELTHSTGHPSRLARPGITEPVIFGSQTYSKEELIGEMGAAFLCGEAGIENKVIEGSASYIHNWLRKLRGDCKLLVKAASQAQKAADYILNRNHEGCDDGGRGRHDGNPNSG